MRGEFTFIALFVDVVPVIIIEEGIECLEMLKLERLGKGVTLVRSPLKREAKFLRREDIC